MKRVRVFILAVGALLVLALAAVAVAFTSTFQTWAARKAIASRPGVHTTLGLVSAGLSRIEIRDLRIEQGNAVLTVPRLDLELSLWSAAVRKQVFISRLLAEGWTLDLAGPAGGAVPASGIGSTADPAAPPPPPVIAPAPGEASATVLKAFAGLFGQMELPVDFSLDGVQAGGDVLLPYGRGRARVTLKGGGLSAGHEGRFSLLAAATLADPGVGTLDLNGGLSAVMDTPRTFTRAAAKLDASAQGTRFPEGVRLKAEIGATRAGTGETYGATVVANGREIISLRAEWPRATQKLDGTWKIDVRDADVAPFALGQPLPAFTARGEGKVDTEAPARAFHLVGRVQATVDRLHLFRPELVAMGALNIGTDFDVAERDGVVVVRKFEAVIKAASPVATVRTLQPFEFNVRTRELRTADTARDLVGIVLQDVPVNWAKPFFKDLDVAGGLVRGEFTATARGGGVTLRSVSPLTADGIDLAQGGQPLVPRFSLAMNSSADYTPQGWQAEITGFTARSGEKTLVSLDAKAGQLAGASQPVKATGKLSANLPAVMAHSLQPGQAVLTQGDASVEFVVSVNGTQEVQAKVALWNLITGTGDNATKLPNVSANLRADIAADGRIAFNAPIQIERDDQKSDVSAVGTIAPLKDKLRGIEAEVLSNRLVIADVQMLAGLLPEKSEVKAGTPRVGAPPWAGLHGSLGLKLKQVIYSEALALNNVTGRLRIDAGMLKLEGLQAGLGDSGHADLSGTVTFDASKPQPYGLAADMAVRGFNPGPLFYGGDKHHPATVDGQFDLIGKVAGRAAKLADLASGAEGDFQITSKGGVFRGLPVNVTTIVENTSRLAAWLASAGTALSAMTGKKDFAEVGNKAEAVAELARKLNPIPYDQLSVVVTRDAALNTVLKDFTLISPEVRLTGGGTALHKPGSTLLDDSLAMQFTLRVRGRQGELLKYLGALDAHTDDLGYATCTVPLTIGGTLGRPETNELNGRLASLALGKSGLGDKAAELLSKIRGGK